MPSPSKPQIAIYAALAVAVLLIGARVLRTQGGGMDAGGGALGGGAPGGASAGADVALGATTPAGSASLPDGAGEVAGSRLVVDVKGAVRRPGVYRLPAGARALDAVRRAGGLTGRADRIGVNLAARVVDGGEVVVPARGSGGGEAAGTAAGAGPTGGSGATDAPLSIDLNTATEAELEQLDGVGPATAAKIVAYREQHGGISSIDELDDVSGIGEAKLAAIHAQLGR